MVAEVQTATNENQCVTFLPFQSGTHEIQAPGFHLVLFHVHETQAPGIQPLQALHYFLFIDFSVRISHRFLYQCCHCLSLLVVAGNFTHVVDG